jgi:hypothetical protein
MIDLERHVVKERPACERFRKLGNGQHCGKRAVFPRSMPGATPRRAGSQTKADCHLLATPTRHVVVERRRKRSEGRSRRRKRRRKQNEGRSERDFASQRVNGSTENLGFIRSPREPRSAACEEQPREASQPSPDEVCHASKIPTKYRLTYFLEWSITCRL